MVLDTFKDYSVNEVKSFVNSFKSRDLDNNKEIPEVQLLDLMLGKVVKSNYRNLHNIHILDKLVNLTTSYSLIPSQ